MGQGPSFEVRVPALLLRSCEALGKLLNLSGPGVPHLQSRAGHGPCLKELL